MYYKFQEQICECGSKKVEQYPKKQSGKNTWTTKKERDENEEIRKKVEEYKGPFYYVYNGDSTYYTCAECEKEVDCDYINDKIQIKTEPDGGIRLGVRVREEVGIMAVNDYTLARIDLKKKDNEGE